MNALFHGGVRRLNVGDRLLPPKNTGAVAADAYGRYAAGVYSRDRVYLTTSQNFAAFYALLAPPRGRGWVYRAEPIGLSEPDPDWLGEPGGSICAPAARVLEIVQRDVIRWDGLSMAQVLRQIEAA